MVYYNVSKIRVADDDGTSSYGPNIPVGVSWVGCDCGDGTLLIGTNDAIYGLIPMTDSELQNHCEMKGIPYLAITTTWFVR